MEYRKYPNTGLWIKLPNYLQMNDLSADKILFTPSTEKGLKYFCLCKVDFQFRVWEVDSNKETEYKLWKKGQYHLLFVGHTFNEHWNLLTFLTWKLKNVDFLSEVYVKFHFMWKDLAKIKPFWVADCNTTAIRPLTILPLLCITIINGTLGEQYRKLRR